MCCLVKQSACTWSRLFSFVSPFGIVNISLVLGGSGFMLVLVWISLVADDVELIHLSCIFPIGVSICSKSLPALQGKYFYFIFKNNIYLLIVCLCVGWCTCHSVCGTQRTILRSWFSLSILRTELSSYSLSCLIGLGSFYTVGIWDRVFWIQARCVTYGCFPWDFLSRVQCLS